MSTANSPQKVGLPPITFLYTLDQISTMLNLSHESFVARYVYFHLRNARPKRPDEMLARNIAGPGYNPDWRIPQAEFVRWLKFKGFRIVPGGAVL